MSTDYKTDHNVKRILIIERKEALARLYHKILTQDGYHAERTDNENDARRLLQESAYDLVISGLDLPDDNGLSFLEKIRNSDPGLPVIVTSEQGSVNRAIEAIRNGARDYIIKPFAPERLLKAVRHELDNDAPQEKTACSVAEKPKMPGHSHQNEPFGNFIGTSAVMQKLYGTIEKAAQSSANVFITGESGTGKEICAEAIHKHSPRKDRPFVPVNCAAIPRDLIESELFGHSRGAFTGATNNREGAARMADGGTLFLDEIAEISPDMQAKLLRFVQTQRFQKIGSDKPEKVDIRIICATNRNPVCEMHCGRFRQDLFYRLHVVPIHMPPLKERGDDALDIARACLFEYARQENREFYDIEDDVLAFLRCYDWPGNIRQLQNIIRQCVIMHDGPVLTAAMLSSALTGQQTDELPQAETPPVQAVKDFTASSNDTITMPHSLAEIEHKAITDAIRQCGGNIPQAAAKLRISPSTIYRKKSEWQKQQGL